MIVITLSPGSAAAGRAAVAPGTLADPNLHALVAEALGAVPSAIEIVGSEVRIIASGRVHAILTESNVVPALLKDSSTKGLARAQEIAAITHAKPGPTQS